MAQLHAGNASGSATVGGLLPVVHPARSMRTLLPFQDFPPTSTPILDHIGNDSLNRLKIPKHFIIYALSLPQELSQGQLDEIQGLFGEWGQWDTLQSLAGYHSGIKTLFGILKETLKERYPEGSHIIAKGMFDCLYSDVHALQKQLLLLLRERETYKQLLRCRDELAQQLLDLLQDLLDSFPESSARPRLSKALLRLSRSSGLHPTCFTLTGMEKVGEQVAGGAFGDIWKGLVGGQNVSVKIMRLFKSEEVKAALQIKNFGREAAIWRQLSHPNVLPFFGLYYLERRLCLVSPWMENGHVLQFLRNAPPDTDRVSLMLDVATGLEYLHSEHVIHGDLKGMNILVTPSRRACVADFGLSSIADAMTLKFTHSTVSARGGTPRYMAPELVSESSAMHFESDVFAFACVCYEMLTGKPPYSDIPNDMAVVIRVLAGDRPERPETISADDSLWLLLEKCWEARPEDRPTVPQIIQQLVGPTIGAQFSQATIDWDETFSAKCRRSLQAWPLLPSVAAIEREIFGDEVAEACLDCFPERRQTVVPANVQVDDDMALISPTISSPTQSEANWHPSILAEYRFGPGYPLPAFQGLQSRWIHVACLANHHIPITSDDPPPQMLEVFVANNDLQAALPLLPQPDYSAWDGLTRSPPSDDFWSSNFFSVSENYLSMRATEPVMMGESIEQYLLPSHGSWSFGTTSQHHDISSSPNPYLTSPFDTPLDDFESTPEESPLPTPVLKDDDIIGGYDQLNLFGGFLESSGEAASSRKSTTSVYPTSGEMPDGFDDFPLLPNVVVTPAPSSRVPAPGPRHTPNSPDSPVSEASAFDARPDVFDDPWSASPLIPSIILSPPASSAMSESVSPPPRSRQGREARGLKHSIDDTLDPSISKNNKRRRIGP